MNRSNNIEAVEAFLKLLSFIFKTLGLTYLILSTGYYLGYPLTWTLQNLLELGYIEKKRGVKISWNNRNSFINTTHNIIIINKFLSL